jgi:hypothetical protein
VYVDEDLARTCGSTKSRSGGGVEVKVKTMTTRWMCEDGNQLGNEEYLLLKGGLIELDESLRVG